MRVAFAAGPHHDRVLHLGKLINAALSTSAGPEIADEEFGTHTLCLVASFMRASAPGETCASTNETMSGRSLICRPLLDRS